MASCSSKQLASAKAAFVFKSYQKGVKMDEAWTEVTEEVGVPVGSWGVLNGEIHPQIVVVF